MHSNVMSQIQFYDTTSTSTSTTPHHFQTMKTRHDRKATIKQRSTSHLDNTDETRLAGRRASVKVETSYKVRLRIVVVFCILTMPLIPQSHAVRGTTSTPHRVIISVVTCQGGVDPPWHVVSHFDLFPSRRGEEVLPLLSHHYSHFDAMRRVCPSSSCHYSHFDATRRVCPSSSCRDSLFPFRRDEEGLPLLFVLLFLFWRSELLSTSKFPILMWVPLHCFNVYIYIFLYMTIFKVYLLDFYPRVVETRHPYPQNPYPCARVRVSTGMGTGPAGDTRGLPVPFTTWESSWWWPSRHTSRHFECWSVDSWSLGGK